MKKRYPVRIVILCISGILMLICIAGCSFFLIRGYLLYRDAVSETSLAEMVETVRSQEHFTRVSDMSDFYMNAVICVEDRRFEEHGGIDWIGIFRAIWTDIRTMSWAEGGSTITQQVAKNLFFTQEKQIERKVAECFVAFALESEYSKDEIFELYVNIADFGSGYYGIYDAAQGYFQKVPNELTEYEAAMLAGVPNAPSVYSPDVNPELAQRRTSQVLQSMVANKMLTRKEVEDILDIPVQGENICPAP